MEESNLGHFETLFSCRLCKSSSLAEVLDLGTQTLTGTFPSSKDAAITAGPLRLVFCENCELVQLGETYDFTELYGENYSYRSSLNVEMRHHLELKVSWLEHNFAPEPGDLIVDIGSNDATTLRSYTTQCLDRVGVDPVGGRFSENYDQITLFPEFFGKQIVGKLGPKKAKIITSIAMFYGVPDPRSFVEAIADLLAPDGVWHFEQSYLLAMLRTNSFDTICHEHLGYYSLRVIDKLLRDCGLRILSVQTNAVNGGSLAVTAVRRESPLKSDATLPWLLLDESMTGLASSAPYHDFAKRVCDVRNSMVSLINQINTGGSSVAGYGASTKGNVTLQYADFGERDLGVIFDVNETKFGCYTPGSKVPIVSATEMEAHGPDYLLVLPWQFRAEIMSKHEDFMTNGGRLIFPFPWVEVVG